MGYIFQDGALFCTEYAKYWPTFGAFFVGLNSAVVPKKWQMSGLARGQGGGFSCSHVLKRIILITIKRGLLEIGGGKAYWITNDCNQITIFA